LYCPVREMPTNRPRTRLWRKRIVHQMLHDVGSVRVGSPGRPTRSPSRAPGGLRSNLRRTDRPPIPARCTRAAPAASTRSSGKEKAYEVELVCKLSAIIQCRPLVRQIRSFAKVEKASHTAPGYEVTRLRAVTTDTDPMILKTKPDAGYARVSSCGHVTANIDQRASSTPKI